MMTPFNSRHQPLGIGMQSGLIVLFALSVVARPIQFVVASTGNPGPAMATAVPPSATAQATKPAPRSRSDEAAIRETAESYVAALSDGDAPGMLASLDKQTIAWYGDALKSAHADQRDDFDRLDLQKKVLVLRLRNTFTSAQLKKMTVQDVLQAGLDNGWYVQETFRAFKLAKVRVNGDRASASLTVQPDAYIVRFARETGAWKMSLVYIFNASNAVLARQLETTGLDEDDALVQVLESLSGYQIDRRTFDGPLTRVERKSVEASAVALKRVLSTDDSVSVQVPENWQEMDNLNDDAILQAADLLTEGYVIVVPDDKENFADLESFASTVIAGTRDRLTDAEVEDPAEIKLNNKPGLLYTVRGTTNGIAIVFFFGFVEGKDKYYQVLTWTLPSRLARNEKLLLNVVNSFREE